MSAIQGVLEEEREREMSRYMSHVRMLMGTDVRAAKGCMEKYTTFNSVKSRGCCFSPYDVLIILIYFIYDAPTTIL